ncbi:MAG TPA: DUF3996 domain-containing protein [bacterium]|nr:DUF3996 domain-containing protein [bacterium]
MKKIVLIVLLAVFVFSPVHAAKKGFGLGIIAGIPTGLSYKTFLSSETAIEAALAWNFSHSWITFQMDYLFMHNYSIFKIKEGKMPLFVGIGGYASLASNWISAGVRVPVGIAYEFRQSPVDIFLQVAPTLVVIPGTHFDVGGGIGVRYWFQ